MVLTGGPTANAASYTWSITSDNQQTSSIRYDNTSGYAAENHANVIDSMPQDFPGYPLSCVGCASPSTNQTFIQYMPRSILPTQNYTTQVGTSAGGHYGYRSYVVGQNGTQKWYPAICVDKLHQQYGDSTMKVKQPEGNELKSIRVLNEVPMSKDDPGLYDYAAIRQKYNFGSREGNISGTSINAYDNASDALIANAVEAASWHVMDDKFGWWLVDLSNIDAPYDANLGQRQLPSVSRETAVKYGTTVGNYPYLAPRLDAQGRPTISQTVNIGLMIGPRSENYKRVDHRGQIIVKNAKEFPTVTNSGVVVGDGVLWTWDRSDATPYPMNFTKYWDRENQGIYGSGNLLRTGGGNNFSPQQVLAAYDFYRDLVDAFNQDPELKSEELTGVEIGQQNFKQTRNADGTYDVSFEIAIKSSKPNAAPARLSNVQGGDASSKFSTNGKEVAFKGLTFEELKNAWVWVEAEAQSLGHATLKSIDSRGEESGTHQRLVTFKQVPMTVTASRTFRFTPEAAAASLQTTISAEGASAASLATPTAGAVAAHLDLKDTGTNFVDTKQVPVKDTVTLSDFDATTYQLFGVLKDVTDDKFIASGTSNFTGNDTSKEITFKSGGANPTLKVGHKYVAYEFAFEGDLPKEAKIGDDGSVAIDKLNEKATASHADDNDLAQTLIVTPQLKTTVSPQNAAPGEVAVTDTVELKGLDSKKTYDLIGVLKDVTSDKFVAIGSAPVTNPATKATVTLKNGTNNPTVVAGHKYVAFEYLLERSDDATAVKVPALNEVDINKAPFTDAIAKHEDEKDVAQTLTTFKDLNTTVTADNSVATAEDEALVEMGTAATKQVAVSDKITASGLDEGTYPVLGVLYNVTDGKPVQGATGSIEKNSGQVDFGAVKLAAGKKYVVHEYAYAPGTKVAVPEDLTKIPTDNLVAQHQDNNDKAQTVVTGLMVKTKVQAGASATAAGQAAFVQANQSVAVTDTVTLAGLEKGTNYQLLGALVDITDATKPEVVASTVSAAFDGSTSEKKIEFGSITPESGHTYVVYEYLYKAGSNVPAMTPGAFDSKNVPAEVLAKHQDNSDQDQLLVTGGTLATTVKAGTTTAVAGSGDQPAQAAQISLGADDKAAVAVTDTVQVTGLNFNEQKYDLVGVLKDVTADQYVAFGTAKVTANDKVTVPLYTDATAKTSPELQAGHKYVVFEFAYPEGKAPVSDLAGVKGKSVADLSKDKDSKPAVAVHADEKDQAQTIVVAPKIATQVMVNGQTGSGGAPLLVLPDGKAVTAKDTVQLTGLTADQSYKLLGVLVDLKPAKPQVVAAGTAKYTATGKAAEEATVELGSFTPEKDHTYVVFEYLYSGNPEVTAPVTGTDFDAAKLPAGVLASHADKADVKQMITTGGTLATTVSAGSGDSKVTATATKAASVTAGTAAEVTTPVVDTVKYLNFEKGATYTIVGELMDVTTGTAVSTGITANKLLQPTEGSGSVELDFGQVKIKAGHKYVAFETAFIGTDTSTTTGKVFAEHKNPADTQQTIVVTPKLATTLQQQDNLQNTNPVQVAAGKVTVVDTVSLQGLSLDKQYVLQGQLVDEKGQPVGEVVTSKPFAGTGDAAQTQDLVFPEITVAAGQKLVAFETLYFATAQGQPDKEAGEVANHKDLSDKAQTLIAGGELRTTVSAGDKTAGTTAAQVTGDSTAKVVDTVTFTGFAAGTTYDLVGVLVEVDAAGKTVAVVAAAQGEFTGKGAAAGTAQIDFGDVQLAAGKKYVVHEYTYARTSADTPAVTAAEVAGIKTPAAEILPGKLLVASHADNTDQAQTIVASPLVLRTTVTAAGETAKADAAAFVPFVGESKIPVTDQVELKGLPAGAEYTVVGLLKDLSSGKYVAVGATTVKDQTQATVTLKDLTGQDPQIEPGKKYVVHEFLYEGKVTTPTQLEVPTGAVAKHENDKDQAQTFVVGAAPQLKTEVVAGTTTGDLDKNLVAVLEDGGKVDVSDRIVYEGLQPGKQYQVTGRLMQLGQDGERFASPKEVAVTTVTLTAAASGSGEWTVKFAEPVAIAAGGIYVVFEQAVPLDQDGKPVEAQTLKHENPNDYPQVIVVKTPEGEIPEIPGDGGGFFPPPGNVPNQGGESSTPTPTKTSGTTVPVTSPAEPENPGKPQIPGWVKWLIPLIGIPALGVLVAPVVQRAVQQPAPAPAPAPAVSAPAAAAPSSIAAPTTVKRPLLAMTGANVIWLLVIALILIGLGAVLVMRRRRES